MVDQSSKVELAGEARARARANARRRNANRHASGQNGGGDGSDDEDGEGAKKPKELSTTEWLKRNGRRVGAWGLRVVGAHVSTPGCLCFAQAPRPASSRWTMSCAHPATVTPPAT